MAALETVHLLSAPVGGIEYRDYTDEAGVTRSVPDIAVGPHAGDVTRLSPKP